MSLPTPAIATSLKDVLSVDRGGVFIVLVLFMYFAFGVYQQDKESEKTLIIAQLTTISQQQSSLQQSLSNMQTMVLAGQASTAEVLKRVEQFEDKVLVHVLTTDKYLVVRTPAINGGHIVRLQIQQANKQEITPNVYSQTDNNPRPSVDSASFVPAEIKQGNR